MDAAFVSGPRMYLERLRHRLRMSSYVHNEKALHDAPPRPERRWRQVEITVQVPGAEWQGIHDAVLAPLAREGADVVCQVHVLARGKAGIRDALLEGPVRQALARRGLRAEIHKQPVSVPELSIAG
jgi:hypothetical protein